jgi:hypothetical protein
LPRSLLNQGDQIARIFANWAILFGAVFMKIPEVAKKFDYFV